MIEMYGKLSSETLADENKACRQIVKEIIDFGVSQRQILLLTWLLAIELENNEHMLALTQLIKDIQPNIFISSDTGGEPRTEEEVGKIIS